MGNSKAFAGRIYETLKMDESMGIIKHYRNKKWKDKKYLVFQYEFSEVQLFGQSNHILSFSLNNYPHISLRINLRDIKYIIYISILGCVRVCHILPCTDFESRNITKMLAYTFPWLSSYKIMILLIAMKDHLGPFSLSCSQIYVKGSCQAAA